MSQYYDAIRVVQKGTKLISKVGKKPLQKENEVLVGIMNNGLFVVAPDVTSNYEFEYFYDAYYNGNWLEMSVYALPKEEIKNCEDLGRVSTKDLTKILEEHPPKTENRF